MIKSPHASNPYQNDDSWLWAISIPSAAPLLHICMKADVNPLLAACLNDIRWDSKLHSILPDLYVLVKLGDVSKQTQVVKKNLTPSWNEALPIFSDPGAEITIELRHKSAWKSDPCVGCAGLRLDELLDMCNESEVTHLASVLLRKKGSGTPAGTLHLRLETADLMSNTELDIKATSSAILSLPKDEAGDTNIAAFTEITQLNTESGLYESIRALLSKLDAFVGFIDDLSKIHPYLAVTWQVASVLCKKVSNQFKADKKVVDLMLVVVEAFNFVRDTNTLPDRSQNLEATIISLLKQTTECCLFVKDYVRHGFAGRMLLNVGSIKKVDEFCESVAVLKKALDSNISLHTAFVSARIFDKVDAIHLQMQLNPDKMNAFDRPLCLPGTRAEIQKQIIDWMVSDSDQNIFWLNGVAGSGKSTISTTIAEHFRGLHRLGAFLFFERGKSDPASVIRTMAYGLAGADSSVAKHIAAAIELDNNIASASAANQFEELIMKPLTSSSPDLHGPLIIVLDALDECGTLETRGNLLELMRRELHKLPKNIRILVTSRKETDIEEALSYQPEFVQEVELDYSSEDSQRDVLEYIRVEMTRRVKDKVSIPEDWPWEANMILLAYAAEGLFVWASAAVNLVSSRRDDPFQALEDLMSNLRSPNKLGLDDLYSNVLRNSGISWDSEVSRTRFSQVLGLILLSKVPLSIVTIDGILDFPPTRSSKYVLSGLQCLLVFSSDAHIHLFHTSFSDYLLSPERSDDPWNIDIPVQMMYISSRCFGVMKSMLHFNICNLESSFVPNDRIYGLGGRIKDNIPPHLAYACLHWSHHLSISHQSSLLLGELSEFVYDRLLYWFEVLSLLKKVSVGDLMLRDALHWTSQSVAGLSEFLKDARKLLTIFSLPISQCTPHVYMSMLPLTSKESLVAAHYLKDVSSTVSVGRIGNRGSTPLLRLFRLEIYDLNNTNAIAFSIDCTRIALGLRNGDIYLWDAENGKMVLGPLKGHSSIVTSIAFSPDGTHMVSGSSDRTIRIWNTSNGKSITNPFEGHILRIESVSFSTDGNRIVSGSKDKTVIIWDARNGTKISGPLRKHTYTVISVKFSPDGSRVVSGSADFTLILWDVESGQYLFSFEGHTGGIICLDFSPDGSRIVSGSFGGTIIVWNTLTGEVICGPLEGHMFWVGSVSFSRDGSRIVSGGGDNTVRIWNVENRNATSRVLIGHTRDLIATTFSMDGTRIISGSRNGEIGFWDVDGAEIASEDTEKHSDGVALIAYSPDGSLIVSVYHHNMIRSWNVRSGEALSKPLQGNNGSILCAVLSPNSTLLALSSSDGTIRICDTESGETVSGPWLTHGDYINTMLFSRDGTQLVSGSMDKRIVVWNVENGKILYGPFQRDIYISVVTFSPDGARIVTGLDDGTIEICDLESGDILANPFKDRSEDVSCLTFSPCGTYLASGFLDGTITIWDYESGQVVSTLYGHLGVVTSLSFFQDGLFIASGSWDKTVRVWDVATGELICGPFTGHSGGIRSVAFSPEGTSVASGSLDGTIRIWNVNPLGKSISKSDNKQKKGGITCGDTLNWVIGEDGWIHGDHNELLLWIPRPLRTTLWHPENIALFGMEYQTRLDFSNCLQGEQWQECFKPPH